MGLTPIYGHATVGKMMTGHKILHAYSPNLLAMKKTNLEPHGISQLSNFKNFIFSKLDDGWPESEKHVFQAALSMVVVKKIRWMVDEFYMSYGGISCEK